MNRTDGIYAQYLEILREELVPAMGCTEPISIAYAAACARRVLGTQPERVLVEASGNLIKNVKSVVVPHTGGLRGIGAAAAAGIVAGDADGKLEVLSHVTPEQITAIGRFLDAVPVKVQALDEGFIFDLRVSLFAQEHRAVARIVGMHTNLVELRLDDTAFIDRPPREQAPASQTDRSLLTVEGIVEFADALEAEDAADILQPQIDCNWAIAEEGMRGDYGANIGKTLKAAFGDELHNRARYMAAAASDARMNGCELPVIINSGSGNQGITASVPVIVYAKARNASRSLLYKALAVSNLCTVHQKTRIGTLSAYCGAVSAGCGAAAGVAYLEGGRLEEIKHTLVNAMAIDSGMICDGAKASCAAKIATSVDAGLTGYQMFCHGNQFYAGDGIVKKGVESTIETVGELASHGMADTDKEIIRLMLEE